MSRLFEFKYVELIVDEEIYYYSSGSPNNRLNASTDAHTIYLVYSFCLRLVHLHSQAEISRYLISFSYAMALSKQQKSKILGMSQ